MNKPLLPPRYEAAYKKPKSGKLKWLTCRAENEKLAATSLDIYIDTQYRNEGYTRYAGPLLVKD